MIRVVVWYAENQRILSENDALIGEQKALIDKLRGENGKGKEHIRRSLAR